MLENGMNAWKNKESEFFHALYYRIYNKNIITIWKQFIVNSNKLELKY